MDQQNLMMQLQTLQQQSEKLQEQLQIVKQHLQEIEVLKKGLDNIEKSDNNEILTNLGKGIFASAELKSKELLINIGNGILVKKSISEAREIIEKQISQLGDFRSQFELQLEEVNDQLRALVSRALEEASSTCDDPNCGHSH